MKNKVGKWVLWIGTGLLIVGSLIPLWLLSRHTSTPVNHTTAIIASPTATQRISIPSTGIVTKTIQTTPSTRTSPTPGVYGSATVVTGQVTSTVPSTNPTTVVTRVPSPFPTTPPIPTPTPKANATLYIDHPPDYGYGFGLRGSGFKPGETITVYWDYQQAGQYIAGSSIADTNGWFSFVISAASSGPGTFKIAAVGSSSKALAVSTVQETPQLFLNPTSATPGTRVTVTGGGFGNTESVTLHFQNASGTTSIATSSTNVLGAFSSTFVVPSFNGAGNAYVQAAGTSSGITSSALFQYPLMLTVTPNAAPVNAIVTIVGYHFTAYKVAQLSFGPFSYQTVALDGNGSFTLTMQVPACAASGQTCTITAVDGMSGARVAIPFTVQ